MSDGATGIPPAVSLLNGCKDSGEQLNMNTAEMLDNSIYWNAMLQ